jgi:hypothetical protein
MTCTEAIEFTTRNSLKPLRIPSILIRYMEKSNPIRAIWIWQRPMLTISELELLQRPMPYCTDPPPVMNVFTIG